MKKDLNEWILKLDMLTHRFGVLYKSKFEPENMPEELKTLSALELGVLNLLEWKPDLYVKNIIELLNVPNSTLTSAIDRLEKKKIVSRSIYSGDKRSFKLVLTDQGKNLIKKRIKFKKEMFKMLLEALDNNEERKMLIRLLEKMAVKIKKEMNI